MPWRWLKLVPLECIVKWRGAIAEALCFYYLTSLIVLLAVWLGHDFVKPSGYSPTVAEGLLEAFAGWDGRWYRSIAVEGYSYDPNGRSNVAFFPGYPVAARVVQALTGAHPVAALLVVSHVFLALSFVLLAVYLRQRVPETSESVCHYTLLAMGLFPTSCFFRMAYSESLFLFCCILSLYAMQRQWKLGLVVLVIGSATATRSVGVALLAPLTLHVLAHSETYGRALTRLAWCIPLSCWGLILYIVYQLHRFGDGFAFVHVQQHWQRSGDTTWTEKLGSLIIFEPFWTVYLPDSTAFWNAGDQHGNLVFSLVAANPVFAAAAVVLLIVGIRRRWLTRYEVALSIGLWAIPYALKGDEMALASFGRFVAVIFPLYIVLGQILHKMPSALSGALLALAAFFLGAYSTLFAAGYLIF